MGTISEFLELGVYESNSLDFKRDPWAKNSEFAKDITAFANTSGGKILLGVDQTADGQIGEVVGLDEQSVDKLVHKFSSWLRECVEPSLDSVVSFCPETVRDRMCIVVDILESPAAPHRAICSSSKVNRNFYYRSQNDCVPADIEKVRDMFRTDLRVSDRIFDFMQRYRSGISFLNPMSLKQGFGPRYPYVFVLHLFGAKRFRTGEIVKWLYDNPSTELSQGHVTLAPALPNADGMVATDAKGYHKVQALHEGVLVCTVKLRELKEDRQVPGLSISPFEESIKQLHGNHILKFLRDVVMQSASSVISQFGDDCFYAFGTLEQVGGAYLKWGDVGISEQPAEGHVELPPIVFSATSSTDIETVLLRPLADMIWRAWGERDCPIL